MDNIPPSDETRLRAVIADLSARLEQAEAALRAAAAAQLKSDTLARRNERLESLAGRAGSIAHNFNNVFAPILLAVALLKEKVTDEKGARMLTVLELNAERGAALVRDVLALDPEEAAGQAGKPAPPRHDAPGRPDGK